MTDPHPLEADDIALCNHKSPRLKLEPFRCPACRVKLSVVHCHMCDEGIIRNSVPPKACPVCNGYGYYLSRRPLPAPPPPP